MVDLSFTLHKDATIRLLQTAFGLPETVVFYTGHGQIGKPIPPDRREHWGTRFHVVKNLAKGKKDESAA